MNAYCMFSKSVPGWPAGLAEGGNQEPPGKSSWPVVCLNNNIGNC